MSNKRLCVLQVTPEAPNEEHVRAFADKEDCDFFFVTHDANLARLTVAGCDFKEEATGDSNRETIGAEGKVWRSGHGRERVRVLAEA